jgi:hypothetical protein
MALLAQLDTEAAELYVLRFIVQTDENRMLYCVKKYAPILELAKLDWAFKSKARAIVHTESAEITKLTSAHFNLIQNNADGWSQLLVWFPPVRQPEADEARLMQRAGVNI